MQTPISEKENWVHFADHSSVEFCDPTEGQSGDGKHWWSILFQQNWFPIFISLLIVTWSYCISVP